MMLFRPICRRNPDLCEPEVTVTHTPTPMTADFVRHVQRCRHCRRSMGVDVEPADLGRALVPMQPPPRLA